jgi:diguanylate cyclase (GGDEF)-like protein
MSLTANLVMDSYAFLLLMVLLVYTASGGYGKSPQHRLYMMILLTTVLLLVLDVVARFDGFAHPAFPALNWWGNLLLFLITPVLPSLWVMYVYSQTTGGDAPAGALAGLLLLNAFNVFMVTATQFSGWFYFIDAGNVYHRGPLYPVHHLITLSMVVWAYAITWKNRRNVDKRVLYSLIFYPIPSVLGGVLQTLVYSYAFALAGAVPALLVVLLYAQDDSIYTDYLTGVGNRKKLEAVLKEKVARCSLRRTFAFIMLDIDNFKKINDTLGHETGDRVLKTAAELLKRCIRSNDYVTRYGGDEFCLILDVSTEAGLNRVVDRIGGALNALNQSGAQSVKLSFSMGFQVYSCEERLPPEAFLKRVDMLMYRDKRSKSLMARADVAV